MNGSDCWMIAGQFCLNDGIVAWCVVRVPNLQLSSMLHIQYTATVLATQASVSFGESDSDSNSCRCDLLILNSDS